MISFLELALKRQSTRRFSQNPIADEEILKCIEAARIAPSASNSQPWKFIVVDNPDLRTKVAKCTYENLSLFNRFTADAPCIIVMCIEKQKLITRLGKLIRKVNWELIDIGIAAQHFCLQAEELGIGTCMIGWYNEDDIKKLLNVPQNIKIGLLIAVGYPAEGYKLRVKTRKKINEMHSFNGY